MADIFGPDVRAEHFYQALAEANRKLLEHHLIVQCDGQWPPKKGDDLNHFDERPDISLSMKIDGQWYPIDIVYMRKMPQEPETVKTVEDLSEDITAKALEHRSVMDNPEFLISTAGSKFTSKLKNHTFSFDKDGYIRIDDLRVVHKTGEWLKPIQASDIHSHHYMTVQEESPDIVNITDPFDQIRTDGKEGMYCVLKKTQHIALKNLHPERRQDAENYEKETGGTYIPLVRTMKETEVSK